MNKAFLSHSSVDKAFVEQVATQLHRARIVFDKLNFTPGKRLAEAITEGLSQSIVFVLFASRKSLASNWVEFEITAAEELSLGKHLDSVLVILTDPDLQFEELPSWMRETLAIRQRRANAVARLILSRLIETAANKQGQFFFGRDRMLEQAADILVPGNGSRPPQAIVISGLPGVGRRTFARRAVKDKLYLEVGPELLLPENAGLETLYLKLLEETKGFSSRSDISSAIAEYQTKTIPERAEAIVQELHLLAEENSVLFVHWETAPLNERGQFTPETAELFRQIGDSTPDPYLIFIQTRRAAIDQDLFGTTKVAEFPVNPLDAGSTRKLLLQRAKLERLSLTDEDATTLLPFVEGFPPAIDFAIEYAKRYGVDAIKLNTHLLVDLQVRRFGEFLKKLVTSPMVIATLRLLCVASGLTLVDLSLLTGVDVNELLPHLNELIDESILEQLSGRYHVPAPLRDSILRSFGLVTSAEYAAFSATLQKVYWADPAIAPPLEIVDFSIFASARGHSDTTGAFDDVTLPSQIIRIAISAYHAGDYRMSKEYAERVLDTSDTTDDLWSIYARAQTRLAFEGVTTWDDASRAVETTRSRGMRLYPYLKGFMFWKKGDLSEAVKWFDRAEKSGDRRPSVFRDRAQCLFLLGQYDKAEADISLALTRFPGNHFVVDLATKIMIKSRNFTRAKDLLRDLERLEPHHETYLHRRATFLAEQRLFLEALADADLAVKRVPPLHEIWANRADILIELERYQEADEQLKKVEQTFRSRSARTVNAGLRCKYFLKQQNWSSAEAAFAGIATPDAAVHQLLLSEILKQKVADMSLTDDERLEASGRLNALTPALASINEALSLLVSRHLSESDAEREND